MCDGNTRRRRKRIEKIFDVIITENFSKLMIGTKSQMQEAQRTLSRILPNMYIWTYCIQIVRTKNKEKSSKKPETVVVGIFSLRRKNYKHCIGLFVRNHASKKSME